MPLPTERTQCESLGALMNSGNIPEDVSYGRTMPVIGVDNTAGDIYFMPALDRKAETVMGTQTGAERTVRKLSASKTEYKLTTRKSDRVGVEFDQEIALGNDLENVKELGGSNCALVTRKTIERDAWAQYKLSALGPDGRITKGTLKRGTVRKQIMDAARDVVMCGTPWLIMTHSTLTDFSNIPEIRDHLVVVGRITDNDGVVRTVSQPIAKAIADEFAVGGIIVVPDYMAPAEAADCIYVMAIQPASVGGSDVLKVAKSLPLTHALVFNKPAEVPNDEAPMVSMYCYADNKDEMNYFDAQGKWQFITLNGKAGCQLLTLAEDKSTYEPGAPAAAAAMMTTAAPAAAPAAETAAEPAEMQGKAAPKK